MNSFRKYVVFFAMVLDLLFGDLPNRFHPVAWMGNLIALAQLQRIRGSPVTELVFGASLTLMGSALVAGIGSLLNKMTSHLPLPLSVLIEAALLKTTFSLRGLDHAAGDVQSKLEANDLPEARHLASWHLVSRDTSALNKSQVTAATIESVAENASDGVIAPLFYYALGGLPLALTYRFVNTADAMLGYRDPAREWLGKFPAIIDDILNFIPARLTGIFILLAAQLTDRNGKRTWNTMRRDAHKTISPNAGYPMSAMAGALGVELEKTGQYSLGTGQRLPNTTDIHKARKLLAITTGVAVFLLFLSTLSKRL